MNRDARDTSVHMEGIVAAVVHGNKWRNTPKFSTLCSSS